MDPVSSSERRITKKLARERRVQLEKAATFKKGPTRKTLKGRKDRAEAKVKKSVREQCLDRDGYCRISSMTKPYFDVAVNMFTLPAFCRGVSELAHFGAARRARTRGQSPEKRHKTGGALMLCTAHHWAYDNYKLQIRALTDRGCDGPLEFTC